MQQDFHIMIKPVGASCNLRCKYCFYLEKESLYPESRHIGSRMPDSTLESAIRAIIDARAPDQAEISFTWQGGEPTLLGQAFFSRALILQKRHAPAGMRIRNSLQTNGTLLDDDFCRFLKDADFLVGVSIDGPRALHDHYRVDAVERGTFDRVMNGIEKLKKHAVPYNLLTVVNHHNGEHPREVYEFLSHLGTPHLQFIPLVEPGSGSITSARSITPKQWGQFLREVFSVWRRQDIGKVHVQLFESILGAVLERGPSLCVHAPQCGRALALEHTGDLYSCDHFVDPAHVLGNISRQPLRQILAHPSQRDFGQAKSRTLPHNCRQCNYLRLCYGGCPKDRLLKTDSGSLNWLCEGYKNFYRFSLPHFIAMGNCLKSGLPASEYARFLRT